MFFRCFSAPILKSGEWAGLCKIDMKGSARKVIKYSSSVVRDWGAEVKVQEYLKLGSLVWRRENRTGVCEALYRFLIEGVGLFYCYNPKLKKDYKVTFVRNISCPRSLGLTPLLYEENDIIEAGSRTQRSKLPGAQQCQHSR